MINSVIQGDCLEVMKTIETESIDSVITDPPYCSGGFTEAQKKASTQMIRSASTWFVNDNMTTLGLIWLIRNVAIECNRLLKPSGSMLIFCDWRMYPHLAPALESSGLQLRNLIVWDKGVMGLGFGFRPQHELVMEFVKGKAKYETKKGRNVIQAKRVTPKGKQHPTEKPVELMAELIKVVTPFGGTVLDPFCGSGTTLVAAKENGYSYIGIEKDEGYVQVARKRLGKI
ncbi:site-specific DNA-methyltransferase (adenine-specific) [Seinonella peptonophila]|uniref:Methyltransferase n=1 Tax=Seinonella peptonophila TaxID=112248 RepID=A0A1M4VC12_9BACL|nr:site-specific DNA-methyltransferase [Seinonella peptonophila]SHE66509.1 site-specific DNA-methyltransferase (adenine-specific) [Seinonella peptonophila]